MATTPQTNATLEQLADVICAHDDIVICGHVSPDGDCIGSQLALYHALTQLGKTATCVLVRDEPLDESLAFLPGAEAMVPAEAFTGRCSVFVGVDVPNRERIGDAAAILDRAATSVTIDHHAAERTMCEHVYVDPDSASASMLVWELCKLLMSRPPLECALCAYTGLVTDTGGFRHQNSDARAFTAASELVAYGVDPSSVSTQVFESRSRASLDLEALAIERMITFAGGQAALSWVTLADFERLGAVKADADPLVDIIRSLAGLRICAMLRETEEVVRGSLRAKDGTDVSVLAREFGGGGHKAASGFSLELPMDQAVELVARKMESLL